MNTAPALVAHDRGGPDSLLIATFGDRAAYIALEEHVNGVSHFRLVRFDKSAERRAP